MKTGDLVPACRQRPSAKVLGKCRLDLRRVVDIFLLGGQL